MQRACRSLENTMTLCCPHKKATGRYQGQFNDCEQYALIIDQVKTRVGIDDRERNCHMDFLRAIICSFKENDGKWSVNGN